VAPRATTPTGITTEIADQLGVAEGTVRIHLGNVYERLHVSSRTAAVTRAFPGIATA